MKKSFFFLFFFLLLPFSFAADLGDMPEDSSIHFLWTTNDSNGEAITRSTDGTISVYKDNGVTQSTAGVTDTEDFDGITGLHACTIDLSADAFYATGSNYVVTLTGAVVDTRSVNAVLATFSIENRYMRGTDSAALATGVNVTQISGDSTAADNLESQYDTTGLNGDTFPATQAQLAGIANTGAAINKVASSASITFGTQTNTYTATQALDGTYHIIEPELDTTYKTDLYYEFDIGTRGVPVSATFSGRLYDPPVTSDDITIQAYDYVAVDWVTVGSLDGVNSSVDSVKTVILFTTNMTAANSGIVRLRFVNTDLSSDTDLYLDLLYCSYSVVGSTTGYANGAIWYDSAGGGSSGSVRDVNGVADNPVDNWTDALSLSASTGLTSFRVINGSSITLSANSDNYFLYGDAWTLYLNGQSISGYYWRGCFGHWYRCKRAQS
jgi:hypothetical protein